MRDLSVQVGTGASTVVAVNDVSFTVEPGEAVGLVGESGSGKSTIARALLGLLPGSGKVVQGSIKLDDLELTTLSKAKLRDIRGSRISAVFQDPLRSLNPVMTVRAQIAEALRLRGVRHGRDLDERIDELLESVGMRDPNRVKNSYPHQLSGGMRQRVAIAVALSGDPDVLIADEPTTALDVTVQKRVLEIFDRLREERGLSLVLVSHYLEVVASHVDKVCVLRNSRIVESGPASIVLRRPEHPYTQALIASATALVSTPRAELPTIASFERAVAPSSLHEAMVEIAQDAAIENDGIIAEDPTIVIDSVAEQNTPALPEVTVAEATLVEAFANRPSVAEIQDAEARLATAEPVLVVDDMTVEFRVRGEGALGKLKAVDGVSLDIRPGETLAIVGESGSGKTTLGQAILRLVEPTSGSVTWDGEIDVRALAPAALRQWRGEAQMIFQDPIASFDPRVTVRGLIEEVLRAHRVRRNGEIVDLDELMRSVGLDPVLLSRYPHQLSGGQAQRVAIARALAVGAELLVLDEPTSALDVSVQAQVLNLLVRLQRERGLSYLFITHDMAVVRYMAHRVGVMRAGELVEFGTADQVFDAPEHAYTRELLSASPLRSAVPERAVAAEVALNPISAADAAPQPITESQRVRAAGRKFGMPRAQLAYWTRRVGLAVVAAWGAITVVFLVTRLAWDPAAQLAGDFGTPEQIAEINARLGLDRPLWIQYLDFLGQVITGNYPNSFQYGVSPWSLIGDRLPLTLTLATVAMIVIVIVGITFGILAAYFQGRALGGIINGYIAFQQSIPSFVTGPVLVLIFAVTWHVFPVSGGVAPGWLVLPVITLAVSPVAEIALILRSSILRTMPSDHVTFARAKGLGEIAVALRHVLRVSLLPIVTVIGFQVAGIFGGVVIVETIFALPGVGTLLQGALTSQDVPLLEALVVFLALLVCTINLAVDIAYRLIDPRLRRI